MASLEHHDLNINDTEILIEIKAIKNIMLHTIEYSNPNSLKWTWKEVIGLLGGKLTDNKIIINNSFAINHGSYYHVSYNKKNYIIAAKINSILSENNEFFVGWYHSHPGLGFFYSDTDILNHIGFQDVNPRAIGIVFDHTGVNREDKFFEIYRLNYKRRFVYGYSSMPYKIKEIIKEREINQLKKIYDQILSYWELDFVESAEKSVKRWLKGKKI